MNYNDNYKLIFYDNHNCNYYYFSIHYIYFLIHFQKNYYHNNFEVQLNQIYFLFDNSDYKNLIENFHLDFYTVHNLFFCNEEMILIHKFHIFYKDNYIENSYIHCFDIAFFYF